MSFYITFENTNCKDCYKCIRYCPVKSIQFVNHQAKIIEEECILCGKCIEVCPQGAKQIKSDIDKVKRLIEQKEKVVVSLAPSFFAAFQTNFPSMKKILLQLGFYDVFETAVGATMVKDEYLKILKDHPDQVWISSCCPSVNHLVLKYYPDLKKNLMNVNTPLESHTEMIHHFDPDAKVVFIGPCIAKKQEADLSTPKIEAAITFEELSCWLEEENIDITIDKVEETIVGKSRSFPYAGGIIESMDLHSDKSSTSVDGVNECMEVLEAIQKGEITTGFIEMSLCKNACLGGPGMPKAKPSIVTLKRLIQTQIKPEDFAYPAILKPKTFQIDPLKKPIVSDQMITIILEKMGKTKPEDELNCGSCGYHTCREKAIALYLGKAESSMCLPYLKNKAESLGDIIIDHSPSGVFVLDTQLEIQLINQTMCKILSIHSSKQAINQHIGRFLSLDDIEYVLTQNKNITEKKEYLADYHKYISKTILYDVTSQSIIGIYRDITKEEKEKQEIARIQKETISLTDKVIEKQMRAVQEIASLLGETTAETKIALSKLKDTLKHE